MSIASQLRIDQTLHGYDRGHRELASTLTLDEESRATMLVFSDLLADLRGNPRGYLTCYPLAGASRHVLARTWPAGSGYRPGSVWTHSLLIDYRTLAHLSDLLALEPLLRRSGKMERTKALKPLTLEAGASPGLKLDFGVSAEIAVAGLYGDRGSVAVVPIEAEANPELLALALWRQMWPAFRRTFSFITAVDASPSVYGEPWNLRFVRDKHLMTVSMAAGLKHLVFDLPKPGPTQLRNFLSLYAVEMADPRKAVEFLTEIWANPSKLSSIRIARLEGGPRLLHDLVVNALRLSSADDLIELVEDFGKIILTIDIPDEVVLVAEDMPDSELRALLSIGAKHASDELGFCVFEELVQSLSMARLADVACDANRPAMLRIRPELARLSEFWPEDDLSRAALISSFTDTIDFKTGWDLFGPKLGPKTAQALLDRTPVSPASALKFLLARGNAAVARVAAEKIVKHPGLLEEVLASDERPDPAVLTYLAGALITAKLLPSPEQAWLSAIENSDFNFDQATSDILIVCFVCAEKITAEKGHKIAVAVFDRLLDLAKRYRLTRDQEKYIAEQHWASGGWGASGRIIRAATTRWPPDEGRAGVLLLTRVHLREVVDEVLSLGGRGALKKALDDQRLSDESRSYIEERLEASKKSWF